MNMVCVQGAGHELQGVGQVCMHLLLQAGQLHCRQQVLYGNFWLADRYNCLQATQQASIGKYGWWQGCLIRPLEVCGMETGAISDLQHPPQGHSGSDNNKQLLCCSPAHQES